MECLIVEDDAYLVGVLRDLIEEMGHTATCVSTIASAMHQLRHKKYDIVVMEYALTDGTTEQLADHVAMFCPNSRVIMITGKPVFPYGEHSVFAPGVDWLMRKPLPMQDLEALLDYAAVDAHQSPTRMMALP